MSSIEKLRLELLIREQLHRHQDEFYTELAKILEKIQNEQVEDIDTRGKPNTFSLRW